MGSIVITGHGRGYSLRKDDSCDRNLVIYVELFTNIVDDLWLGGCAYAQGPKRICPCNEPPFAIKVFQTNLPSLKIVSSMHGKGQNSQANIFSHLTFGYSRLPRL